MPASKPGRTPRAPSARGGSVSGNARAVADRRDEYVSTVAWRRHLPHTTRCSAVPHTPLQGPCAVPLLVPSCVLCSRTEPAPGPADRDSRGHPAPWEPMQTARVLRLQLGKGTRPLSPQRIFSRTENWKRGSGVGLVAVGRRLSKTECFGLCVFLR